MHKALKPAIRDKKPVKKLPKEVTLMIESKMLEETQTKADLRISSHRQSKGSSRKMSFETHVPKIITLKDISMTQRISSTKLRPSTSRDRIGHMGLSARYDNQDFPFRPKINSKSRSLSRNRSRQELSQPKTCRNKKCSEHDLKEAAPTPHTNLNPISNFKCFERLLYRVTSYFENEKVCWEFKQLTYANAIELLHRLQYMPCSTETELMEANHVDLLKKAYHFWLIVSNDELTATLQNFFVLVCAIQKIQVEVLDISRAIAMFVNYLCRRSISFRIDPPEQPEFRWILSRGNRTFNEAGELQLDPNTLFRIPAEFSLFIVNRLNSQVDKAALSEQSLNPIVAPLLSDRSSRLADKKRRKMIQIIRNRKPDVQTVTLNDILNFKTIPNHGRERPTMLTSGSSQSRVHEPPHTTHQLKISASQLCFLARPKRVIERQQVDLEFERVEHICTFQPQIHEVKRFSRQQSITKIPNVSKSIERMKEGRLFRKKKKHLIETGWTNSDSRSKLPCRSGNKQNAIFTHRRGSQQQNGSAKKETLDEAKFLPNKPEVIQEHYQPFRDCSQLKPVTQPTCESSFKLPTEETVPENPSTQLQTRTETLRSEEKELKIPLLFIDINIDETKKERIVIYDEDSSEKLAAEFARRHNLDGEMQAKLRELLEYQMSSILTKIEEEAEEQQNF